jgi:hypothetical protein
MILCSPTKNENGGFPFVARVEQGVIRVSSFTHAVASATPTPPSWIPLRSIQATILKPIFTRRIFQRRHRSGSGMFQTFKSFNTFKLFNATHPARTA